MLWMHPCEGFILSGSVWPIYLEFHSCVFMTYIRLGTPCGDLICVYVTVLCTLWSAALYKCYECVIGHHVWVPCAWSSCWQMVPYHLLIWLSFPTSTAGMPSKGLSNALNCSVPGRGISGLLRGWLFPFPTISLVSFALLVVFFICGPLPVTTLVTISSRFRYRFILSGGAIGKGKSVAFQSLSPRLP